MTCRFASPLWGSILAILAFAFLMHDTSSVIPLAAYSRSRVLVRC